MVTHIVTNYLGDCKYIPLWSFLFTVDGPDFMEPNYFNVTFVESTSVDTSECVVIPTVNDMNLEGDHNFTVSITFATPTTITIGTSGVTATLLDDEGVLLPFTKWKGIPSPKPMSPAYNLTEVSRVQAYS